MNDLRDSHKFPITDPLLSPESITVWEPTIEQERWVFNK